MTAQAQLFETGHDGTVTASVPQSDKALALRELTRHPERYDEAFHTWIRHNWKVWNAFCRLARAAQLRGRKRYSARGIFHVLRFHSDISEAIPMLNDVQLPGKFKVNNIRSAAMARLFNSMERQNNGFFNTRTAPR